MSLTERRDGATPLLAVTDLTVRAPADGAPLVDGVTFTLAAGERVGLIGESGSGKSLTASAVLGVLPPGMSATGSIRLDGDELLGASEADLHRRRGVDLGAIFQDPRASLNPLVRVIDQVAEPLRGHGVPRAQARAAALDLLEALRLPDHAALARRYPGALSGGQRQRVAMALALIGEPRLLVADEPTSALDVSVQADVLAVLTAALGHRALLFITHDLAVAAMLCDRVIVLDRGRVVDEGPTHRVIADPRPGPARALVTAARALAAPIADTTSEGEGA